MFLHSRTRRFLCRASLAHSNSAIWQQQRLPSRKYSFLGNLFRQEAPIDRNHVKVSLFDKESVLQDFTASLHALLSREDVNVQDCVDFLREAAYPPKEDLPSISSYSTLSIIKLLDALTYLCDHADHANYRTLLDMVAGELARRELLPTEGSGENIVKECIKCVSRIRDRSKTVDLFIHAINKEIRSKAELLLRQGHFVEIVGMLSYIVHPSVIDMIVHKCCCKRSSILPNDISKMPKLLTKFKIVHEKVIDSIMEHVSTVPSVVFENDITLSQDFISHVADMPYMENSDGHLREKPIARLTSLLLSRIDIYNKDDLLFLLLSIPVSSKLPPDAKKYCREIAIGVLSKLGILIRAEGALDLNQDIAKVMKEISDSELMSISWTIGRVNVFHEDALAYASQLQSILQGKGQVLDSLKQPKMHKLTEAVMSEMSYRIKTLWEGGISKVKAKQYLMFGVPAHPFPYIRLLSTSFIMDTDMSKEEREPFLQFIESNLGTMGITKQEIIADLINDIALLEKSSRFRLLRAISFLIKSGDQTQRCVWRLFRKLLGVTPQDIEAGDVATATLEGFLKEDIRYILDISKGLLGAGIITRQEYDETESEALRVLRGFANRELCVSDVAIMSSTLEASILESVRSPGYVISPIIVRNVSTLPISSPLRVHVDQQLLAWSMSDDKGSTGLTLEGAVEYTLAFFQHEMENAHQETLVNMISVLEASKVMLQEFELLVEGQFSRNNYGYEGEHIKNHHVWEATVGLRPLFRAPDEPLDIFTLSKLPMLKQYFHIRTGDVKSNIPPSSASLYHLKCHLQALNAKVTSMQLALTRHSNRKEDSILDQYLQRISLINQQLCRCVLAVDMATPILPNTYLPRRHTERLVNSAIRRFA